MLGTITREQMTEGPLLKKLLLYTLPIMATGLLQLLFNAADLIVVGRYSSSLSLAAVGSTGALINLIVTLFIGLSAGTSVAVAQRVGAGDDEGLTRTVHTSIATALAGGLIVFFIGFFGSRTFLSWMGTPDTVIDLAVLYMKIYFIGIPANLLYNFAGAVLRASGDTKWPLIILTAAGVLNVGLNLLFVIGLGMSVDGVALATVISQAASALAVMILLCTTRRNIRFRFSRLRFHGPELAEILRIGIPAGIQGAMFSISNVIIQKSVNSFGDDFMSGNSAAGNIEGFVYVAMNAFHQTSLTFTGQNVGARKPERINRVLLLCEGYVFVFGFGLGMLAYLLREPLLGIYLPDAPQSVQDGMQRMRVIATTYFTCGAMDVMNGSLRGMGSSFFPMLITVVTVCGMRIVWIYTVFAQVGTPFSLYVSYPISWILCLATQVVYYIFAKRSLDRHLAGGF